MSDDGDLRLVYSACGSFFVFQENPRDLPGAWEPCSEVMSLEQVKDCASVHPSSEPLRVALRSLSIFRPGFRGRSRRSPV